MLISSNIRVSVIIAEMTISALKLENEKETTVNIWVMSSLNRVV